MDLLKQNMAAKSKSLTDDFDIFKLYELKFAQKI